MAAGSSIDQERLWADVMALAAITDPQRPYTRRSFSPLFVEGRAWLRDRFAAAGLQVRIDPGGNLIGRMEGDRPALPAIMLGSHSDTVPSGGRFDGVAGLVAALEVTRALGAGDRPRHALEVVDFLAEEPSEFGVSCVGSRAMAGLLLPDMLDYAAANGERLGDAIDRIGGATKRLAEARRSDIAAYLELHIEQGVVLESKHVDVGVVTGIVGIARLEVVFQGAADHAGTTPMTLRRDAAVAAARSMAFAAERATALSVAGRGHFVATTGIVGIEPNAANVVPGHARIVFDIRAEDLELSHGFIAELNKSTGAIAKECRVERTRFALLSDVAPVACDTQLEDALARSAARLGLSVLRLASGAGHDAAFVAGIAPSAMLFIPCRGGKSHAPDEWAEPSALAAGASVLLETVRLIDQETHANVRVGERGT
jgi:beta-ureidopropionase / N-carbamoyl-L-amino-acid hydrolase